MLSVTCKVQVPVSNLHNFIHFSSAKFRKQPTKPSQNLWNSLKKFGRYRCSRQKLSMEISKSINFEKCLVTFKFLQNFHANSSRQKGLYSSWVFKIFLRFLHTVNNLRRVFEKATQKSIMQILKSFSLLK